LAELVGAPKPADGLAAQLASGDPAAMTRPADPRAARVDQLRPYVAPVIRLDATPEQVAEAATKLEAFIADKAELRAELGAIARRIIDSGRLDNYGTPPARDLLRKWADAYGPKSATPDKP
jgi:hypothetical protein